MKIQRYISGKTTPAGLSEIYLRLTIGRGQQYRLRTGVYVSAARFDTGRIRHPRTCQTPEAVALRRAESELSALELFLSDLCTRTPSEDIDKQYLTQAIDDYRNPEKYAPPPLIELGDALAEYMDARPIAEGSRRHLQVLGHMLDRFERYSAHFGGGRPRLTLDTITARDLTAFADFLRDEHALAAVNPALSAEIMAETGTARRPRPRSGNTIAVIMKRLRAFLNWCHRKNYTDNRPFDRYEGGFTERYGTPYFITIDERDHIAAFDLSADPALATQRDIFVFQCLIGCRVSDLLRLTRGNIVGDAVEYMPVKTRNERPEVVRVPLLDAAAAIVARYAGTTGPGTDAPLLPFISPQKYNLAIKAIFAACGVTRLVTVRNPLTGDDEQRRIDQIAGSHIARRTFIGNLYPRVKDPALIGKLSGHAEGSRAFARYRDITDELKKETLTHLLK